MSTKGFCSLTSLVFGASFLLAMASASVATAASPTFAFYQNYLEQTSKAESLKDVGVFMPEWWNQRQQAASAADQASAVERIRKSSQALKDVVLEREEPSDSGVRLHMTARSNGLPMQGTVLLVKESGAFKVEESAWRSVEPLVK